MFYSIHVRQACAFSRSTYSLGLAINAWHKKYGIQIRHVQQNASSQSHDLYDVAVVGAGVVGLAVAREAACRGARVLILERADAIASGASSGNR